METMSTESNDVETSAPPHAPAAPPRRRGPGAATPSTIDDGAPAPHADRVDSATVREWLNNLGGDPAVKISIIRVKPLLGAGGENVSGVLETVEDLDTIDDEYLREVWGGGTFGLKVNLPKGKEGSFKFEKYKTIKIAGEPKMRGMTLGRVAATPIVAREDPLALRAFDSAMDNAKQERERADRIERERANQRPAGLDIDAIRALNAPLQAQLERATQTIADMQMRMMELSNKPPVRDEFRDRLMERSLEGEGARIEALRTQHEGRINRLQDDHRADMKRLQDNHDAEVKRIEDRWVHVVRDLETRHDREIAAGNRVLDAQSKGVDQAYAARLDALKDAKDRLERELGEARAKIGTLEARKDQTMGDKISEIKGLKEIFDDMGGGDDGKEETLIEKIIGAVGQAPAAMALINKIGGGDAPAAQPQQQLQQPQQQQLPPPGVPFQTEPGGPVYVRDKFGQVHNYDQAAARKKRMLEQARQKQRARNAAAAAPAAGNDNAEAPGDDGDLMAEALEASAQAPAPVAPPPEPPTPGDMKIAISFMENAITSGKTTPEQFARSVGSMVPADAVAYIAAVGVDHVLGTAGLDMNSPLRTVAGKQFARKVFKFLSEGASE